jgi:hypothetical protein
LSNKSKDEAPAIDLSQVLEKRYEQAVNELTSGKKKTIYAGDKGDNVSDLMNKARADEQASMELVLDRASLELGV